MARPESALLRRDTRKQEACNIGLRQVSPGSIATAFDDRLCADGATACPWKAAVVNRALLVTSRVVGAIGRPLLHPNLLPVEAQTTGRRDETAAPLPHPTQTGPQPDVRTGPLFRQLIRPLSEDGGRAKLELADCDPCRLRPLPIAILADCDLSVAEARASQAGDALDVDLPTLVEGCESSEQQELGAQRDEITSAWRNALVPQPPNR